ncbi:TPA: hypothetical protein LOL70_004855 [Salmonella enterica subsp. enterica serovar Infantis]|nr:hypothetical protein [Salmonella enterica subsp. enterica serovar Infantis]
MTDITELAQRMKAAAESVIKNYDCEWFETGRQICTVHKSKVNLISLANPANVLALAEALEKAQQEAEELSKFKEVMTSAAEALKAGSPLNLESLFKGELASAMFAMMLAGEFIRSGATNYLELLYDAPEFGGMTVTLQKVEGKTPGQRIAELEESNAQVIQDKYERERGVEGHLSRSHVSKYVSQEDINEHDITCTPLYRHAQQPVVPEEKPMPNTLSMYAVDAVAAIAEVKGWNACRAAMLNGGKS